MSDPNPPPANGYGEVIGNSHQTVNFASAVLGLVQQPLTSFMTNRNARTALRTGLGEWVEEAFDANDHCQQPILREDAFVEHLIDNTAAFRPSGTCDATFAWAKLLYALDIRPGKNIIEWRPLGTDADPNKSGTVELALEGPVFCHIVNLYQVYDDPYDHTLQRLVDYEVTWQFPFGALTIHPAHNGNRGSRTVRTTSEPESWTVTFKPQSNKELSAPRQPFVTRFKYWLEWSGGPLPFEPNSIAIKYVSTVKHSMCSDGALRLPGPRDTMKMRCHGLSNCLKTLMPVTDNSDSNPVSCLTKNTCSKPYLVTPAWIEQANRIKRRVTTNGGLDHGLAEFMVQFISQKPAVVERIMSCLRTRRRTPENDAWVDYVMVLMKNLSFYEKESFYFVWYDSVLSTDMNKVEDILMDELPNALNSLAQSSPRTWLRSLSEMVPDVVEVLRHQRIGNCPVLVLQLVSGHQFWRSTFYVQGEVPTR
ncbi:hypothetical protein F5Y07DRAFT_225815 [Xylaria sp. FL0933]|nr:hypothetical protein F5Y07DRAFT_225815 [Xylaria sp. FL0933]